MYVKTKSSRAFTCHSLNSISTYNPCAFWAKNTHNQWSQRASNLDAEHTRSRHPKWDFGPLQNHLSDFGTKLWLCWGVLEHLARPTLQRHNAKSGKYSPTRIARERQSVRNLGSAFTSATLGGDFSEVPGRIKVRSGVKYHATLACQQR